MSTRCCVVPPVARLLFASVQFLELSSGVPGIVEMTIVSIMSFDVPEDWTLLAVAGRVMLSQPDGTTDHRKWFVFHQHVVLSEAFSSRAQCHGSIIKPTPSALTDDDGQLVNASPMAHLACRTGSNGCIIRFFFPNCN